MKKVIRVCPDGMMLCHCIKTGIDYMRGGAVCVILHSKVWGYNLVYAR